MRPQHHGVNWASIDILDVRDGLKMIQIHTASCPTQMIDRKAIGNWATDDLDNGSMHKLAEP